MTGIKAGSARQERADQALQGGGINRRANIKGHTMIRKIAQWLAMLTAVVAPTAVQAGDALSAAAYVQAQNANFTQGPTLAVLGDSFTQRGELVVGTQIARQNYGYTTWFQILSGHRFYFPPKYNFGVGGDTLAQMLVRVPQIVAIRPALCIVEGGTNSLSAGVSLSQMQTTMRAILGPLLNACGRVAIVPVTARAAPSALTAAQELQRHAWNQWLFQLSLGRDDLYGGGYLSPAKIPIFVDVAGVFENRPSGGPNPYLVGSDLLHPNINGAYVYGATLCNVLCPLFPVQSYAPSVTDSYDATNNVTGNLIPGTAAQFTATYGNFDTLTGVTATGSIATGWRAWRDSGTAPSPTWVYSKESPRTDFPYTSGASPGERQIIQLDIAQNTGTDGESYVTRYPYQGSNVAAGDTLVGRINYQVMDTPTAWMGAQLELRCEGSTSNTLASGVDGYVTVGSNSYLLTTNLIHKGVLETPPITCPTGTTGFELRFVIMPKAGNAAVATHVKIAISDASVRKVLTQ